MFCVDREAIETPPFSLKEATTYTKYVLAVQKVATSLAGEEIEHLRKVIKIRMVTLETDYSARLKLF